MVAYDLRRDPKLDGEVGVERGLDRCPAGHGAVQAPSWVGCDTGGHRTWTCRQCHARTDDPDCPCQGGGGSTWGGQLQPRRR